jgi:RNA polymerase sigma-70 factor, ECF subfamily
MTHTTSATLLHRVRQSSDQLAWKRFVDLYTPLIFEWGCRDGLSESDASDLSQEVLIHLLTELPRFQYSPERGRFRGWLRTVTVNKCREFQRRKNLPLHGGDDQIAEVQDDQSDREFWEIEYQQKIMSRALQLMQSDFESQTWQAAWQQIVDGRKPAEIATELGMSIASIYQARSRVLRQLRAELQYLVDED